MITMNYHSNFFNQTRNQNEKTFRVNYSFYFSDSIEVEAENEKEACDKVESMIEHEEIGNTSEMNLGDSKVWID